MYKTLPSFNKVVVWGHKLIDARLSNTFAFIHREWYRTFQNLGYDVIWLDDSDNVENISFENCLFLTEGQVDKNIPIVKSSKYVLHNCNLLRYQPVIENVLNIQTYIKNRLPDEIVSQGQAIDGQPLIWYQPKGLMTELGVENYCNNRTLHMYWATNLLPHEIDPENTIALKYNRQKRIFWVGSIMGGPHRNDDKIEQLKTEASKHGVQFIHAKVHNDMQPRAISESWIAPALMGQWQVDSGYIPCRVFKNLSFGRMAHTNSSFVNLFFENKLVCDNDVSQMFIKAQEWEENPDIVTLKDLVKLVRDKHTFVNRVHNILEVL